MNVLEELKRFFKGSADFSALSFVLLTLGFGYDFAVSWKVPLYAAVFGITAYFILRYIEIYQEVRSP